MFNNDAAFFKIIYGKVTDPEYIDASGDYIGCQVEFPHLGPGFAPFVAYKHDSTEHGRKIYQEIVTGKYGSIKPYDTEEDERRLIKRAKEVRDAFLDSTQWIVDRHRDELDVRNGTTISNQSYLQLLMFRRDLRDWPSTDRFPKHPPFPPLWLKDILGTTPQEELK